MHDLFIKEMHLQIPYAKYHPFCLRVNMLTGTQWILQQLWINKPMEFTKIW